MEGGFFGATFVSAANCGRDGARPSGENEKQAEIVLASRFYGFLDTVVA